MKSKALLLLVVLTQLTCHQVIFTAPPGATMECFSNPEAIGAFNGVSVISCHLIEETGAPVADGTVVQFFTNLGRVQEQGRTNDGVVRVNLQADGRSGTAVVQARSGGGTISTTPTSATSTSTTVTPLPGRSSVSASASSSMAALLATGSATVVIGNTNAAAIIVTAFPPRLTDSRTSQITASVSDGNGNPVAGVPIIFEVLEAETIGGPVPTPAATPTSPGGNDPIFEHMDSQGQPVFTDSNGQAHDVLRTRYPRDAPTRRVVVRATIPFSGTFDEVTVFVN